jgi:hypothetical protein
VIACRAANGLAAVPAALRAPFEEDAAALTPACDGAAPPSPWKRREAWSGEDNAESEEQRDLAEDDDAGANACSRSKFAIEVPESLGIEPAVGYMATKLAKPRRKAQCAGRRDEHQALEAESRCARGDASAPWSPGLRGRLG